MTRVVVTGAGAVSACGLGREALWHGVASGQSGVCSVDFPAIGNQRVGTAAALSADSLETLAEDLKHRMRDPVAVYAVRAAHEAIEQAGLTDGDFGDACGVVIGSGFGGAKTLDDNYMAFGVDRKMRLDPMAVPKIMTNAAASWVSMEFGASGPIYASSTACSSGSQSIGLAYQMLKGGAMQRCLAGGSEACLVGGVFRVWELLRVMTAEKNRPFSKDRNGMTLGEGAGILVMETLESAQARGADILCEIVGYGTNSDAGDLLRPNPKRASACMELAIADAGVSPSEIGYVNAQGTGTVANDVTEVGALRDVFGADLKGLEVSSTKPIHGHALGAAGAIEAVVSIEALRHQIAPPTINFNEVDPKIGIDPVANTARPISTNAVMSNSLAFGGINASLVFAKFDG
ncbi:beta-ketoacyl-[acyl-carrier-protein] synthase family protein [uncultured Shimia sp.]|uniref:beta-ketoacyl-[acyl-carrier-protein] synthase family protein n=1 Tax=uncultured Shimia sp. TaxID=573152 RepID=UPI00262F1806|nr:beta-ketoacyl-[acyl-carrier-protein] synthase family protein [uncultured Shimia sp.]